MMHPALKPNQGPSNGNIIQRLGMPPHLQVISLTHHTHTDTITHPYQDCQVNPKMI